MTRMTRVDVEVLAEAWRHVPEASAGSPMLAVRFSPAALLMFMDLAGMLEIEATVEPSALGVTSGKVTGSPDTTPRRIEAREPSVGLVGDGT